jgi:hypothetical protein
MNWMAREQWRTSLAKVTNNAVCLEVVFSNWVRQRVTQYLCQSDQVALDERIHNHSFIYSLLEIYSEVRWRERCEGKEEKQPEGDLR